MGKKNLLVMAASIFLATANAPTATAQEAGGVEISTTSILPITGVTAATDGNYNFKSFDGADGVIGGHEYVDLGLPSGTLWATYNVGATSPYEKGDYFAWGEVEPREDFSWENYKFFERYEVDPNNGEWAVLENIGNDISGTEYDAARYQWGNG